ncbi:kinase-like protein [Xylaria sp. FL0933]|nr:kinase-like protein [Xylaria sp. FL0933]
MALNPHPKTLFHLVPANQVAYEALSHPDNKRFVSSTKKRGKFGLEVGYHVPSTAGGHVITRIGRNADLILRQSSLGPPMSGVHVAFEINPATELVILSVRSKQSSSVRFAPISSQDGGEDEEEEETQGPQQRSGDTAEENIMGDGVILYGQDYKIFIASYEFKLRWWDKSAKTLALQGYRESLQRVQDIRSRDRPTEIDKSDALSWHMTRLNTAKASLFKDIPHLRERQGEGTYGIVYKGFDQASGNPFVIKVIKLEKYGNIEAARALVHREIKIMEKLHHAHIIEYLGQQHFNTPNPEIFMPLREGSLAGLIRSPEIRNYNQAEYGLFCRTVLEQMLSAIDYLASQNLIHRDIKPDNILYDTLPDDRGYHLQLADFGLANHRARAETVCGTVCYQAPELWPDTSKVVAAQSPKMDVWSLFVTMVAVDARLDGFPPHTNDYGMILSILKLKAQAEGAQIEPMGRLHPDHRASAAQMLELLFDGKGLTTPRSRIPPIELKTGNAFQKSPSPVAGPSRLQRMRDEGPRSTASPLIVYPPHSSRLQARMPPAIMNPEGNAGLLGGPRRRPIHDNKHRVTRRRPTSRPGRAKTHVRPPHEQELPVSDEPDGRFSQAGKGYNSDSDVDLPDIE